jgi:hypothetical protein
MQHQKWDNVLSEKSPLVLRDGRRAIFHFERQIEPFQLRRTHLVMVVLLVEYEMSREDLFNCIWTPHVERPNRRCGIFSSAGLKSG